mgnify:CR=1 FL=1
MFVSFEGKLRAFVKFVYVALTLWQSTFYYRYTTAEDVTYNTASSLFVKKKHRYRRSTAD